MGEQEWVNIFVVCLPGYYLVISQQFCQQCPPGTYNDREDFVCIPCPYGTTSTFGAASRDGCNSESFKNTNM